MDDEFRKFFSAECYIEREGSTIARFLSFFAKGLEDPYKENIDHLFIEYPRQYSRSYFTLALKLNQSIRSYPRGFLIQEINQYVLDQLPTLEEFVDSLGITISSFTPEVPKVVLPHISNKLDFILENDEKPHEYLRKNNYKNGYQSTVNHTHKSSHIKM